MASTGPVVAAAERALGWCAAVLAGLRSGGAVVSHLSAARLLGLPLPPLVDARVAITRRPPAPDTGPRAGAGIGVAVHVSDYDDRDVQDVDGVPVAAGARLVLDCSAVVSADPVLAIADKALFRQLTTRERLYDELERRRGQPGLPAHGRWCCGPSPASTTGSSRRHDGG